jgi:hypothetical protein
MTRRDDLLHLSPEALSQLANAGLVKRALRELAGGYRPQIAVDEAGLLGAQFSDGVHTRWPQGVPIQQAQCSCGAATVCRHRVIAALAYREGALAAPAAAAAPPDTATPAATAAAPAPPAPAEAPGVGTTSDEALARVVPPALLEAAQRLRDAGIAVEVRRRGSGEPCDTARLPAATVRYWAGAAIEAARCDCVRASACEHVALGVWAFREADAHSPGAAQASVRLGAAGARHTVDRTPYLQLAEALLRHGVARGPGALMQALSTARAAAADAAWLALLLADLETWAEAYARRSARYDAAEGADLLAELALRLAAGGQPGQAGPVLGTGQAGDTALDRLRLMCLGARTVRDGERRRTTLLMADVDTGTRLVLPHDWQVPEARQANEAALRAAERVAPGVQLEALARGQLLAQQAARRADGSVRLARARSSQNSVLPQSADWAMLGSPVRFDSVAALAAQQCLHPSAALQPRHAARHHVVFSPAAVERLGYDANEQCVFAALHDAQGGELLLQRTYEPHVPHALDSVAAALGGHCGPLRHVAGALHWDHGQPCIEPWALACDQLVVPDFAAAAGALAAVPLGLAQAQRTDPCARGLEQLRQHLGVLLHHGLVQLPRTWLPDTARLARQLRDAGLRALGDALQPLGAAVAELQSRPGPEMLAPAVMGLLALRQLHEDAAAVPVGEGVA